MALINVLFKRERGADLAFCSIYLNGEFLPFVNDEATKQLEDKSEFELYWRMLGAPGATLSIKYKANGTEKTAVKDSKIPADQSRKTDFAFIKL